LAVHSPANTVSTNYIDDLVKQTKGSQRTKYSMFSALATWVRWAEKKGHIADAHKIINCVTNRGQKTEGKREVFTPAELIKLLEAASPEVKPVIFVCAFGGLRKAEALRVRWEQIDLVDGFIRLEGPQVKTQSRRAVQILPTLNKWLETIPASERTGKLWKHGEKGFFYHQKAMCSKAGVPWKHNGLRHSAISARCCNGVTLGEVADWAGNSVSEIKKHYLALISKADADEWWKILP
jgi:integrase